MQTIISQIAESALGIANLGDPEDKIIQEDGFHTAYQYTMFDTAAGQIDELSNICHEAAAFRGWWHSPLTEGSEHYILKERNVGELIALMHSELSEALEAARKDAPSDKIEGFTGVEEELADCLIRIFDFSGAAELRLGEAFVAKMKYNSEREDHKLSVRMAEGGKKI